jgi:hypothetical protein
MYVCDHLLPCDFFARSELLCAKTCRAVPANANQVLYDGVQRVYSACIFLVLMNVAFNFFALDDGYCCLPFSFAKSCLRTDTSKVE